ncbi:hypothetical protein LTR48_001079 [Friedmanniomyces endolithicus]|uniref:Uncharacterized protein n=1 Tax=Rachicladosporium monterosium TaxID=1507873 RepID=A0ABR0L689_9PEZI|nr:hypothetical protein LTR29_003198 [Friedmanniomyces endolithicus]KAK1094073.1 hypothetical protein LTR48_001079 [Friedmanniomyces endolithicus]KAK1820609.1 hypothetical protein LTR12_004912 [Friedmanniomyces endolithicus]KAK5143553.1 hypothetical protein LTR32_004333 [Rachicladosporium monterosium]
MKWALAISSSRLSNSFRDQYSKNTHLVCLMVKSRERIEKMETIDGKSTPTAKSIDGGEYNLMLRVELYFTAAILAYGEAGRPPTAAYVAGFRDSQRSRAREHERRNALSLAKQRFHAVLTSLEGSTEARGAHLVIGWGRHYAEEALRLLPATTPDILAGFVAILDQLR